MIYSLDIIRDDEEKLSKKEWRFDIVPRGHELHIILESYSELSRPSRRHKYEVIRSYRRILARVYGQSRGQEILDPKTIDLLQEIKDEIYARILSSIKIVLE